VIGLAYRVPVIGSRIGGIPEIIDHGVNGLLFQPGNSDELASVIEGVAKEPEIIQRLAENIVTPRRTEEEALDYENIYMKLTSR
jgi:glycosyltransferase involved in cell wall biosynthesis